MSEQQQIIKLYRFIGLQLSASTVSRHLAFDVSTAEFFVLALGTMTVKICLLIWHS
jgi:hypothetical protein